MARHPAAAGPAPRPGVGRGLARRRGLALRAAALLFAVNFSGDSDSTGSICGNLLGAWHGEDAVPAEWLDHLEGRAAVMRLADELAAA